MHRRPRRLAPSVASFLALLLGSSVLAACGSGEAQGVSGRAVRVLYEPAPPPSLLNLTVQPEDVSEQVRSVDDQYLAATALYSLRADEVVQATLQISRFSRHARPGDEEFRRGIIVNLGGAAGVPTTVSGETVYITQGSRQRVAAWFRDRHLFILTTRQDFEQPRSLLRAALEVGR